MYKSISFRLTGQAPAMFCNGHTADPLNSFAKMLKELGSMRIKSDERIKLIRDVEWLAGFYHNAPGAMEVNTKQETMSFEGFGHPNWPGQNIEAMLHKAAKKHKWGKMVESGIMCDGPFVLTTPKLSIAEMFEPKNRTKYRDERIVSTKTGDKIVKCRPYMPEWEVDITFQYIPSEISKEKVITCMETACALGLSDSRPRFGRFSFVEI